MRHFQPTVVLIAVAVALAGCPRNAVELVSISLTPENARINRGQSVDFVATGVYSDSSVRNVTGEVRWQVLDGFVAAVDAEVPGRVSALNVGTTRVRASLGEVSRELSFSVVGGTVVRLEVQPARPVVPVGLAVQLTVNAVRADGSVEDVTRAALYGVTSGASSVTVRDELPGVLVGAEAGTSELKVSFDGAQVQVTVAVTDATIQQLTLSPSGPSLPLGSTLRLRATASLSDGRTLDVTEQAQWTSSAPQLVFVSTLAGERGTLTARALGTTEVQASLRGAEAALPVIVTDAVLSRVEVSPSPLTLARGTQASLVAHAVFSDGTRNDVTTTGAWSTDRPTIATVTPSGQARALNLGAATLRFEYLGGAATVPVTVTAAELVSLEASPSPLTLAVGTSAQVTATGRFSDGTVQDLTNAVLWGVRDDTIAQVSNTQGQRGLVQGLAVGATDLTATFSGVSVAVPITVTTARLVSLALAPATLSLPLGTSTNVVATGTFSDGSTQNLTTQVSWTSSAPNVVSVDPASNPGLVRALALGSATIRAQQGSVTAQLQVSATAAALRLIELTPTTPTLAVGTSAQLTATGVYSDATTQNLTAQATWSSDDPAIASVSNAAPSAGLVRALAQGSTQLHAAFQGVTATAPLQVTAAALVSLSLSQTSLSLPMGVSAPLTVTGTYSDGSTQDVTAQATWSTADGAVATASNASGSRGLVRGVGVGSTSGQAALGSHTASFTVTVTPALLTALSLTPPTTTIARGFTQTFVATGTYSDGTTRDVSAQVTWSVTGPALAVSAAGEVSALDVGTAEVVARQGTIEARRALTVSPAVLVGLDITPALPSTPLGLSVSLTATGTYSDGSTADLTAQATWSSSNTTVATVSNASGSEGLASTVGTGAADVSATLSGQTATTTLTVLAAALDTIEVTPSMLRIASGTGARFQATGRYTDGTTQDLSTQVTWSVSDTALASVSNAPGSQGHVTTQQPGQVQVRATRQGVTGAASLDIANIALVSLAISPSSPSAPAGRTAALTVVGTFSDGSTQGLTDQVTWGSSDATTVTVSNAAPSQGLASARVVGAATVSATMLGQTGTATFTVTDALLTGLEVSPLSTSLPRGLTRDFVATGRFSDGSTADVTTQVTWSSSSPATAAISNASGSHGRATGLALGTTTVSAQLSGQTASAGLTVTPAVLQQLQVSPASVTLPRGLSASLTVTGVYSDASTADLTTQVTWSSTDGAVATVSNASGSHGLVQALAIGNATISATLGSVTGTRLVTITAAQLTSVQVGPPAPSLPRGRSLQLSATGHYTDGSTQDVTAAASWSSADTNLATVSNATGSEGRAQAVAQGTVTLTATVGARSGTVQLTVTPAVLQAVQVTPSMPSVASGLSLQLTATGVYSDASTQDLTGQVTWTSANGAVVSVSNASGSHGLATGAAQGTADVTATLSGVSGSTPFTVTPAVLQQLQVTPANPSRPRGLGAQLTATGLFSDGSTLDLTTQVTWTSGNTTLVAVSNASGSEGQASAQNVGATTVTATLGGIVGSTPFTVTAAELVRVDVTPTTLTVPRGTVRQLQAIGRYTDGSSQTLTTQAAWSSSDPSVLDVSNAAGSEGLVTAVGVGTAQVTVTYGAFTTVATLTVTQAALAFIELNPASGATPLGYTRQFIAIGHYTDNTTQVLTSQAVWSSSDTTKALISNASSSRGLLSTVDVGTVTIEATYGGVTGSTTHTVSAATLVSLTLSPSPLTVAQAASVAMTALGSYSDGSTQDLTATVTWTSLAPSVAQVSNASGSKGLVTGVTQGNATVRAQSGSVSQTASVTVTP